MAIILQHIHIFIPLPLIYETNNFAEHYANEIHVISILNIELSGRILLIIEQVVVKCVLKEPYNKMSDIEAFLRLDRNFQRINITTGSTGGRIEKSLGIRNEIQKRSNDGAEYSDKFLMDEQKKLFQVIAVILMFRRRFT